MALSPFFAPITMGDDCPDGHAKRWQRNGGPGYRGRPFILLSLLLLVGSVRFAEF